MTQNSTSTHSVIDLDITVPEGMSMIDAQKIMEQHLKNYIKDQFLTDFGPDADGGYDGPVIIDAWIDGDIF